jgi:hypothetical protein
LSWYSWMLVPALVAKSGSSRAKPLDALMIREC